MRADRRLLQTTFGLCFVTASSLALAQGDPAVAPEPAPAVAPEPQPAPPPEPPPPAPQPAPIVVQTPAPAAVPQGSDHDAFVGSFAIGYMGRRSVLVPDDVTDVALTTSEIQAPVIGIRYWASQDIGIDAGFGFWSSGGSTKATSEGDSTERDDQGFTAFILHGGVPIALASAGHFSFQVVPEANVGFGSSKIDNGEGAPETKLSGFHLDVGARAGAEIHFGFIKIPQLSLQASVGARFSYDKVKAETGDTTYERSIRSIGTNLGDNPWNIFTSNVAALYYF